MSGSPKTKWVEWKELRLALIISAFAFPVLFGCVWGVWSGWAKFAAVGETPGTKVEVKGNRVTVREPYHFDPPRDKPKRVDPGFQPGDEFVFLPSSDPPQPGVGFPVARFGFMRNRLIKLSKAEDVAGMLAECDGLNLLFCRAGTVVRVIDTEEYEGELWAEVRLKSGAYAEVAVWVPAQLLGKWKLDEHQTKNFDEKQWPKEKRKAILHDYFVALGESLVEGAKEVGGRFDPKGERAVRTKRMEVEKAAVMLFHDRKNKVMQAHDVKFDSDLDAIIITELAAGERVPFTDR